MSGMKLSRRSLPAVAGFAVLPGVALETEESLRAEALAVDACYAKDYTEPPERWNAWHRRWRSLRDKVASLAEQEHPGWSALSCVSGDNAGELKFVYVRDENGRRVIDGMFTVPYLASDVELTRLIRRHRPQDYEAECGHLGHVTWVPA